MVSCCFYPSAVEMMLLGKNPSFMLQGQPQNPGWANCTARKPRFFCFVHGDPKPIMALELGNKIKTMESSAGKGDITAALLHKYPPTHTHTIAGY